MGARGRAGPKGNLKMFPKTQISHGNKKLGIEFEGHVKTVKRLEVSVINVQWSWRKKRGKDWENLKQIIKSVITKCYSTIYDILNKKKPLFQLPNLVKNNCGGLSANTGLLMPLISLQKTEKQCFITKCSCYWPKMNEAIWLDLFLQAVGLVKWHLIT